MHEGWVDVTDYSDLAEVLGIADSALRQDVYSVIRGLPDRHSYWLIRQAPPRRRRDDRLVRLEILRTRVFLNWSEAKKIGDDVVILGVVYLATQNLPLTTLLGAAKKLKETMRILSEQETEVVRVIMGIASPASAYAVGVPETQVRAAYKDAVVDIDKLLDSLQAKKIIQTERVGQVRLVI